MSTKEHPILGKVIDVFINVTMIVVWINAACIIYLLARDRYQAPDEAVHEVLMHYKTQYNIEHFGMDELRAKQEAYKWARKQMDDED